MNKRSEKFYKTLTPALKDKFGEKDAMEMLDAARRRLEDILAQNADETPAKKAHTHSRIYPAIALFHAIAEKTGDRERARAFLSDFYAGESKKAGESYRRLLKFPGLYKRVPKLFVDTTKKVFGTDAGFAYKFIDESRGVCRYDMLKCPYTQACERYGCPELTAAFCDSDDYSYGNLHPKLEWRRTKTLGKGGDCCDFSLRVVEK